MLQSIEVHHVEDDDRGRTLLDATKSIVERLAPGVAVHAVLEENTSTPFVRINARAVGTPTGGGDPILPEAWQIEAAVAHALEPRFILFMCVANSARSQMAEAMARALAPPGVEVASAGSTPTQVRSEAIAALHEMGLGIGDQQSKSVDDIDVDRVQLVVTLCDEEVCPTLLRPVPRLHWPIPDPAKVEGDEETRMRAFRAARDAIRQRLYPLFHG